MVRRSYSFCGVAYAGACVHTPAPPPNQMIVVSSENGVKTRGPFEAVTVVGRLSVESRLVEVPFIDGSSQLEIAYSLSADQVSTF
ncbi:DUF3299 domain-containing protein [Ruegeria sp. HKCCA6837]|uniref:DUF3299 domain-containing protein n=1 Tax=Ruegeria sp. HKCCA6837 TaxID=2682989 RepID=UPI00352D4E2F